MIQMIYLPDLHGRSSLHEQAGAISFYNWQKAVVLASLHAVVLFPCSTRRALVSRSVQGHLELLLWSVQSFFMISLRSGLVLIWYQREREPLEPSERGEPRGVGARLSKYKATYLTPQSHLACWALSSLSNCWVTAYWEPMVRKEDIASRRSDP